MENKRIKEYDLARAIAIIFMIAVHTLASVYDGGNTTFYAIFTNLGSPFCAPIFMFILGSNIYTSKHNSPKELFTRGLKIFSLSYLFNIVCHALPYFILDHLHGTVNYAENALHWIFAVDILTFAGLAFMFFGLVRYLKLNNKLLVIIAVVLSFLNMILVKNYQIDFETSPILAAVTSLFYNSSMPGYFSFFGWIIFPIAGYLFIQFRNKATNLDKFYLKTGGICLIAYVILSILAYKVNVDTYLVYPGSDIRYYYANPYEGIGYVIFCIAWISIMYFLSKITPTFINKTVNRLSHNLTTIYVIQWFLINYLLVLPTDYSFPMNEIQYILAVLGVVILADLIAASYKKYIYWSKR